MTVAREYLGGRTMVTTAAVVMLWCVISMNMALMSAQPTELNGKYEYNDSIIPAAFPGQSTLCTDELLIDAANGTTSMLPSTAFTFEDGDDPCSDTATFEFSEYNRNFGWTRGLDVPGLASFQVSVDAQSGYLAFMPDDESMSCGRRTLSAYDAVVNGTMVGTFPSGFMYMESGSVLFTGEVAGVELPGQGISLEEPSLIYFGAVSRTGDDSIQVPLFCAFTKVDDSVCFPGSGRVTLEHGGSVSMAELQIGDRVLTKTDPDAYSEVFLFGHREPGAVSSFFRFTLASGKELAVSPRHYIYSERLGRTLAKHVMPGEDALLDTEGQWDPVVARKMVLERGVYSPHTLQGDLIVDGYRVTSYSDSAFPGLAHILLAPLRLLYRVCGPRPRALFGMLEKTLEMPSAVTRALRALSASWCLNADLKRMVGVDVFPVG